MYGSKLLHQLLPGEGLLTTWTGILGKAAATKLLPEVEGGRGGGGKRLLKPVPFPNPFCPTLVLLLAVHFSRVVVIASSPEQTHSLIVYRMCSCMWRVYTCMSPSVYLWVRSMGAKSGKWCHQANWRLIKACWSAPINLSATFSFQTVSLPFIHVCLWHKAQDVRLCLNPRQDMSPYLEVHYIHLGYTFVWVSYTYTTALHEWYYSRCSQVHIDDFFSGFSGSKS